MAQREEAAEVNTTAIKVDMQEKELENQAGNEVENEAENEAENEVENEVENQVENQVENEVEIGMGVCTSCGPRSVAKLVERHSNLLR